MDNSFVVFSEIRNSENAKVTDDEGQLLLIGTSPNSLK